MNEINQKAGLKFGIDDYQKNQLYYTDFVLDTSLYLLTIRRTITTL